MAPVVTLEATGGALEITVGAGGWCRCRLMTDEGAVFVGAESAGYLASHLQLALLRRTDTSLGQIEGHPVWWVLSLAEAHFSLYVARPGAGMLLFWQDAEARLFATMQLTDQQGRYWQAQLLALEASVELPPEGGGEAEPTRQQRDALLVEIEAVERRLFGQQTRDIPTATLRHWMSDRDRLVGRYLDGLPKLFVGRCPFCAAETRKHIDTFGLDGPWWDHLAADIPPEACEHFFVMLGALNFRGAAQPALAAGPNKILFGPEVPFVVPRLMALAGMRLVISSAEIIDRRCTAFFMSYYADPPAPAAEGHQPWLRETYGWVDQTGHRFWGARNDPWDFDLQRWLDRSPGSVLWIDPDDTSRGLQSSPLGRCPYLGVKGRRGALRIVDGKIRETAPPDGSPVVPHVD